MYLKRIVVLATLHIIVALVFLKGFLLTRVELPNKSICSAAVCTGHSPAYSKAVVLIVDALRYDFLCDDGSDPGSYRGRLPKTLGLVGASEGAAVAARFVADTPTITMSRLKALLTVSLQSLSLYTLDTKAALAGFAAGQLLTSRYLQLSMGGLPTFLDVGQSFSASALTEDNLLQQLLLQGKKLVAVGDDTWMQLAKDAFSEAYPYPSFDVHDLHTVDNGVWEHLIPLLARPNAWDVLIAHYLGVDHAGHTYGVNSRQMEAKLAQMDDQVSQVIESLVAQAGPGGVYADTVLLVLSDHGQTLGGDHGGGTPDETDSVLIAVSLRKMHAALQRRQQDMPASTEGLLATQVPGSQLHAPDDNATTANQHVSKNCSEHCTASKGHADGHVSPTLEYLIRSTGYLLPGDTCGSKNAGMAVSDGFMSNSTSFAATCSRAARHAPCWPWLCGTTLSQIDLTPLLAHLLGVPIPFGNLGKIPPHLFAALAAEADDRSSSDWLQRYAAALHANADQVHTYLNQYAVVGGLPAVQLSSANKLYEHAQTLHTSTAAPVEASPSGIHGSENTAVYTAEQQQQQWEAAPAATEELIIAQLTFLSAAVDLARRRFTLFQQGPIWAGCALGVAVLALQLMYCWQAIRSLGHEYRATADLTSIALFAALTAFHALGLFSVGLLMGEGRLQCALLAAATLLMLRSALTAIFRARALALTFTAQQGAAEAHSHLPSSMTARMQLAGGVLTDSHQLQQWPLGRVLAVGAATAGMLACNVALQAVGLIDRSGQDPHDKTQPSADLLVGPDAVRQQVVLLGFTVGPLLLIWMVFANLSDHFAYVKSRPQTYVNALLSVLGQGQQLYLQAAVVFVKILTKVQYVCLGVFWVAQLTGSNDMTVTTAGRTLYVNTSRLICSSAALEPMCKVVGFYADRWGNIGSIDSIAAIAAQGVRGLVAALQLPIRLLLPRAVYVPTLINLCAVLVCGLVKGVAYRVVAMLRSRKSQGTVGDKHTRPALSAAGYQLLVWLCASFTASLIMVLGYKGPAIMLLAVVQASCCCFLLQIHATASRDCCWVSSGQQPLQHLQSQGAAKVPPQQQQEPASLQCVVVGTVWGMMTLQLYFCSSHFCEFSGLQYASAFIGFDSMVWYTSGSLLLLNTCGFFVLGVLSLPVFLAVCIMQQPGVSDQSILHRQIECSMLVVNSSRFAAIVVCMVSAAVQQQHILLWAIFAPKLVFELWFMAVTDVSQLLSALLTQLLL